MQRGEKPRHTNRQKRQAEHLEAGDEPLRDEAKAPSPNSAE
jgi:hypothetical protein